MGHLLICEPRVAFHWAIGSYLTHLVPELFTLYLLRQGNANHVFQLLTKYNVLLSRTYSSSALSHPGFLSKLVIYRTIDEHRDRPHVTEECAEDALWPWTMMMMRMVRAFAK